MFTLIRHTAPVSDSGPVRAAGVVVLRTAATGPEVAVIHRNLRSDWSLPKGKVEPGEHAVTAAVRECDEETGIVPILGLPLPQQEYVALGRPKVVDYWVAKVGSDEGFAPDDEVDEVLWLPAEDAAARMTYPRDGDLVRMAVQFPTTTPLIVLRHTQAMKRSDFGGKVDHDRPLSGKGRSQAKALVPLLGAYGIEQVYSSDAARCRETVKRFAKSIDATVEVEPALSEEGHDERPKRAARRIHELMCDPAPMVVCTHRPVLPTVLDSLSAFANGAGEAFEGKLPPGGFLVIHRQFTQGSPEPRIVAVERHTVTPE